MSDKPRYPRALALAVAKELCDALKPFTHRLIVAGSLRRRKQSVGDIEILFIPQFLPAPELQQADLLAAPVPQFKNVTEETITALVHQAVILPRKNINGSVTWGPKNKLAFHVTHNIPVDLFTATESNWFNYLVCRTGSAENNIRISTAAQTKGWQWNPCSEGFTDQEGNLVKVESEHDVFRLAGLPWLEPHQR